MTKKDYKDIFMENFNLRIGSIKIVKDNCYWFKKIKTVKNKKKHPKKSSYKDASRKEARKIMWKVTTCESCLCDDRKIEIHHIDHNPLNNNKENLIWLCCICHYEVHKDEPIGKMMYKRILSNI